MSLAPGDAAGDAARERLAAALGRHYAAGRLDTAALDERLGRVYGAATVAEVAAVLADLPALPEPAQRQRRWGRRHGEATSPEAGWLPTTERFRDPTTRRIMRVWVDPVDSARHYIAEPEQ
jgi:hypothetical protein